ncbi:FUSC family protein [Clostridium botulinum C]|uniref:FUSC family protein n=5 Tax=Clostridium TaxID=1485 RepID=A0A9Q4XTL9_CLOBO|nr:MULTISPECIES: aromatic acid exporter family protein [Clostridium]EGO88765.1 hypothetical protein CBCST_03201 [Clostridium botulinum C str. Stockholm]AYF53660.1 FUSC family protein [Clostridium novyi]EES91732.1 conserved hypothetical protein [Clostridium botulinum D str. 1873]KEI09782.1 hypothetical protein Z957_03805 [Clostridium sp. K25]KEI12893.1 hypothetical protein Z959_03415 [Clostridium novyi B str. ATCC 27606]
MKKIGMRNLKTSIAVVLCVIIIRILHIDSPFYACIAAVICMQTWVSDSFIVGKNRMIGTFIGALIGLLLALIKPGNIILIGIGIIGVIYICNLLGKNKSITIGCIVFLAIMVNLTSKTPLIYSTFRLIETFIGIFISVFVNYFVFPRDHSENLYNVKEDILNIIYDLSENKIHKGENIDLSKLENKISHFESLLNSYMSEITRQKLESMEISNLREQLTICKDAYNHLCMLNFVTSDSYIDKEHPNLDIVYNYHLENLSKIVETLKNNFN